MVGAEVAPAMPDAALLGGVLTADTTVTAVVWLAGVALNNTRRDGPLRSVAPRRLAVASVEGWDITVLLVTVRVPLMDARMNSRCPTSVAHWRRIPMIFLLWYSRA
ncbi:MAG: hypothetical protein ACJAZO_001459 [Myxococcota bacterium]